MVAARASSGVWRAWTARSFRLAASILFVLGIQLGLTTREAEAHLPPPVYITMKATDEKTEIRVVVLFGVFREWFKVEPKDIAAAGGLDGTNRPVIGAALRRWLRVRIDGLPGVAELQDAETESFEDHMVTWEYVKLHAVFTTQVPPQQISIAWLQYADSADYAFDEIDAELEAYGESHYPLFREREPEFIWHRPREVAKQAPPVLPQPVKPPHVTLPLVSVGLLLALLVGAFLRRKRTTRGRMAIALGLGVLAAVPLMNVARVDVPLPWTEGLERPADEDAIAIFASLHRGVYAALDGETEDEVYDSLAASVTGTLLPKLYMDINESMILQNEGGAVAKVKKTEILETSILPERESGAPWFKVNARWRVEGKVGHWGHTHQRINEYLANVTVVAVEGRWKIADIEVLDETRVDDGKKVR